MKIWTKRFTNVESAAMQHACGVSEDSETMIVRRNLYAQLTWSENHESIPMQPFIIDITTRKKTCIGDIDCNMIFLLIYRGSFETISHNENNHKAEAKAHRCVFHVHP